jgi:hypothetical protein
MAKVERERAMYEGQLVTVIKRGKQTTEIRNAFGFAEKVKTKKLGKVDGDAAKLTFEEP